MPRPVGDLSVSEHIRNMFWTAGPALGISLAIFLVIGLSADASGEVSTDDALEGAFNVSLLNLLPLALLVVFTVRKVPPFLAIQTASYLPFCFFNLLSPVRDVLYGFIGFKVKQVQPPVVTAAPEAVEAQSA